MTQDEFYENIPAWISKDKSSWNHITLMAYFCHKYEQKNGVRFRLVRWKSDPGKGKESRDFSKLFKTLAPENYSLLSSDEKRVRREELNVKIYNYINWMFDYKFRRGDRSVTGTQIFLLPSMINEFERMYSSYLAKKRQNSTFEGLMNWIDENVSEVLETHDIEDIGDIKMLQKYADLYSLDEDSLELRVVSKAKQMNLI